MTLLTYCKWNTWRCQFAISNWHQDLEIGPWHRRDNGSYPAERNAQGSYTTSVSVTIMPRLYCNNWKIKVSGDLFFSCCYKKYVCFLQTALLSMNISVEKGVLICHQIMSECILSTPWNYVSSTSWEHHVLMTSWGCH